MISDVVAFMGGGIEDHQFARKHETFYNLNILRSDAARINKQRNAQKQVD